MDLAKQKFVAMLEVDIGLGIKGTRFLTEDGKVWDVWKPGSNIKGHDTPLQIQLVYDIHQLIENIGHMPK